jgi:TolB-like protein
MKRTFFGMILSITISIMGCAGGAIPATSLVENSTTNSGNIALDQALKEAANRIDERIVAGAKIAPLNFNSPHDNFSSYVLDELTANLVDSGKLTVVDRKEVDLIRGEFDFQFSGEVGDDSMQELGRMLGAQSIISGSLTDLGGFHRIVIRVLNVQNASVEVQYRANITNDAIVVALLTGGKSTVSQRSQTVPSQNSFPRVGRWIFTGGNTDGNFRATGNLVIEEIEGERFSGYFDWYYRSNNEFIGKTYFRGTYNVRFRTVEMKGYRVSNPPLSNTAIFEANLSRNGRDFETGTWGGPGTASGTWEAIWQE